MAPEPNGWRVNPRDGWRVNPRRQYGVFNPSERRLSQPGWRLPLWAAVVLAACAWAAVAALVAVGMQLAHAVGGGGGNAMSFTELHPAARSFPSRANIPVLMGCNKSGGRFQPWTSIVIHPERVALPWIAKNATARVHIGNGQDAGKLRVSAKGPFSFRQGKLKSKALLLRIPGLQTPSGLAQPLRAVSYQIVDQSIIIDLPGWALGKTSQQAQVANAPGVPFKLGAPSHADVLRGKGVPA